MKIANERFAPEHFAQMCLSATLKVRVLPAQCGTPEFYGDEDEYVDVPSFLLGKHSYVFRAAGRSMEPTIPHGALLIVEGGEEARDGALVIVQTAIGMMVKRYDGRGWLHSDNPTYPPVRVDMDDHASIVAIVKHILLSV